MNPREKAEIMVRCNPPQLVRDVVEVVVLQSYKATTPLITEFLEAVAEMAPHILVAVEPE